MRAKRDASVNLRLSKKERTAVAVAASKRGVSSQGWIRMQVLDGLAREATPKAAAA